jgi:acyl-CoA thioester hydrolase
MLVQVGALGRREEAWRLRETALVPVPPVSRLSLRVRWAECDAAGVLYHAHALDWFSEARVVWLEGIGASYYQQVRQAEVELLVLDVFARFPRALHPGDAIDVTAWVDELSPTRMRFVYRVEHQGRVAVEGFTRHAFVRRGRAVNLSKASPPLYARLVDALPEEVRRPVRRARNQAPGDVEEGEPLW